MNTLLVGINAKYSHTCLAVRYLKHALEQADIPADFVEYTINQSPGDILADIVSRRPHRLLFSCYIWNIEHVRRIGADFRLLFPHVPILLGGPEVSFDPLEQLAQMPWASAVLTGEGEPQIARVLGQDCPHGAYSPAGFADLDALPFPYEDLSLLQHRVLYYESSRGCPYGCAYCLSSADRTVRFRGLPLVFQDLQRFLDARVMQVKFVDRTFNLDSGRALAIWRYLSDHDNGVTSFQMELGGDLTTPEQLAFLRGVRSGLFQFEIGVQSTCGSTLAEVARITDLEKLMHNVKAVKSGGNIHQHLDLIAGLPLESFARFATSYDQVFALRPQQLQLGFLKLLRGSKLYANRAQYGLIHSALPPYEILSTPQISFGELAQLKQVEEMTEVYFNSGRFTHLLEALLTVCPSPFTAFLELGETMPCRGIGKYEYYDLLFDYAVSKGYDPQTLSWLMRFDLALHERPRRLPQRCGRDLTQKYRREIAELGLPSTMYTEVFPLDVTDAALPPVLTALVFDYEHRDTNGHALWKKIDLG